MDKNLIYREYDAVIGQIMLYISQIPEENIGFNIKNINNKDELFMLKCAEMTNNFMRKKVFYFHGNIFMYLKLRKIFPSLKYNLFVKKVDLLKIENLFLNNLEKNKQYFINIYDAYYNNKGE